MVRGVFWAIVAVGLVALLSAFYLGQTGPRGDVVFPFAQLLEQLGKGWAAILLCLSGSFAGFVGANRGARVGSWSGWAGVTAATMMFVLAFSPTFVSSESFPAEFWIASAAFQVTIGLTVCSSGAAALFGYDRWRNIAAIFITLTTWAAMILFLHETITLGPRIQLGYFLAPLVGLAILAATSLPQMTACAILIGGGAVSLIISYWGFALPPVSAGESYRDTYYIVAHSHYLISVLGIFTLLAALVVWAQPRLPAWPIPLLALLILIGQVASYAPMVFLGRIGMPRRYVDYPEATAIWNLISTTGTKVMILALITALFLLWLRRTR